MKYLEVSASTPIAVRDTETQERIWWDKLDEDEQKEAEGFPKFDLNRKKFLVKQ